ncbi:glycosyltransferase family 4 protein [Falsiroseomonas sp. E2-1-a20]|uniref:glycosyltransferase family 4 protein n=1 Tax=Falsiroseomonas sp. E2-1-a20 TaxID=3239300 RepID=UPI003F3D8A20
MVFAPVTRIGHLLILLPATRWGGTEAHTAALAARLAAQPGLRVTLAAEPALLASLHAASPARLVPAAIGWQQGEEPARNMARQQAEATRLIEGLAPDLLLVPLPWPNAGLGLLRAAAQASLPRLVVAHLVPHGAPPPEVTEALPQLGAAGTTWCAVSSPGERRVEACFGLPRGRVAVIDNPAPPPPTADPALLRAGLRASLGLHADAPLLLFVGRLERGKGAQLLPGIAAAAGMTLACAGSGPLGAMLERQAAARPGGWFRMLGQLPDPTPWYLAADALVLPSLLEGLPLVFLEAAAAGCPLVATEAAMEGLGDAAPDLAWLVPDATVPLFAAAVRDLMADPAGRAAIAARARAEAARRSWDRILPGWLGLLRAAASNAHHPEPPAWQPA